MINLFNQSTGRTSLTKTKGLILASVIALVSVVPCPVFAQVSGYGYSSLSTVDNSPASWTLSVVCPLATHVACQDLGVVTTAGFPPFSVQVESVSNYVAVSFGPSGGGGYAGFFLSDISGLSASTTTVVPQFVGNVNTVAGFANPAVVTVTRANAAANSPLTVVVRFSNNTANPADMINNLNILVGTFGLPMGAQNSLQQMLGAINLGNPNAACNQLNSFKILVSAKTPPLTTLQAQTLTYAADQIKVALGCPP